MSALREALRELPDAVFADVLERDDSYLFVLDLPGVTADAVELSLERGLLYVEAAREPAVPSAFERVGENREAELSFELPVPMDASGAEAEASIERGVLELTLPKRTSGGKTTIPVTEQ